MKITTKILSAAFTFIGIMTCCTNEVNEISKDEGISKSDNSQLISLSDAIEIGNSVLNSISKTRKGEFFFPSVEYVVNEADVHTRSINPDTLAYILNYPADGGFAIISAHKRIYPVLAYSDESNFLLDNEIAKKYFIDNISLYIEQSQKDNNTYFSTEDFETCETINPIVGTKLNQRNPFDKYVKIEHPGCPVGCVAVAAATVMSYGKTYLDYHGSRFFLKRIVKAIEAGSESPSGAPKRIVGGFGIGEFTPVYTYSEALDSMAKLLYWIGKDINIVYKPGGSEGISEKAYNLIAKYDYNMPSGWKSPYDIKSVANYIRSKHIIYFRGRDFQKKVGHAWVCDGCAYCWADPVLHEDIDLIYLHMDWGWGGNCNGYFSGDVFNVSGSNYEVQNYFAVKRTWKFDD